MTPGTNVEETSGRASVEIADPPEPADSVAPHAAANAVATAASSSLLRRDSVFDALNWIVLSNGNSSADALADVRC